MKRSKMITKLKDIIEHNLHLEDQGYDNDSFCYILEELEKAGMLPPKNLNKNIHEDDCAFYDGDDCDCGGIELNEWDEE